jgi:hypothetical protein
MRNFGQALFALVLVSGVVHAHTDRLLTLRSDGSIREVPASFGRTNLTVKSLGTNTPSIRLKIGAHLTTLPPCATRFIRTRKIKDIRLTGSWYHDETVLPYYINVEFFDPGYNPKRTYNSSYRFLFNLHNAQLIHVTRHHVNLSGGSTLKRFDLPKDCKVGR